MAKDSLGRTVEKPRYGGDFVDCWNTSPIVFDEALLHPRNTLAWQLTHDELFQANWTMGNSGTQEWDYRIVGETMAKERQPMVAESWEILPDGLTIVWHIRHGIKWQNKDPKGPWSGRELTADDVAFSWNRSWTLPTAYLAQSYPYKDYIESITVTDKYTMTVKTKVGMTAMVFKMGGDHLKLYPKDACEQFGTFTAQNDIGSGAYMLTDWIDNTTAKFVRNPDYYEMDPFFPSNKLPYPDTVTCIVMPDASSRLAAIRTGKLDKLGGSSAPVSVDDGLSIIKTNPELKYTAYLDTSQPAIYPKIQVKTNPTYDVRVRQALTMSINYQGIIDTMYKGKGVAFNFPMSPIPGWLNFYTPLDKMPADVQKLYSYNIDGAKQLMSDAGFAKGFDCEVVCTSRDTDMLSVIKDYWSKINVNMKITVMEPAAWTALTNAHKQTDMCYYYLLKTSSEIEFRDLGTGLQANYGDVSDPKIDTPRKDMLAAFTVDEKLKILGSMQAYVAQQQYIIALPASYTYCFWEPWVKGYSGEDSAGITNMGNYTRYLWIDKDMKKAAGH